MQRLLIISVMAAVLVAGVTAAGTPGVQAQPNVSNVSSALPTQLMSGAQVDTYLTHAQFHGYILLERHGRVILSKGYGLADVEHHVPHTIHTRWPIFSIESFMAAMAVLTLQEAGQLHLQDRLCRYVAGCPASWRPITIHDLLTGTSGIADYDAPYFQPSSLKDAITGCEGQPPAATPGTLTGEDFSCNFLFLSVIIAKAAGRPFAPVMQQRVFRPAGLTDTSVATSVPPDSAHGYQDGSPTPALYVDGYPVIYSSVADIQRLDHAFLAGKIVSKKARAAMETPYVGPPDWPGFSGYGTGVLKANKLPMGGTATGVAPFKTDEVLSQGSGGPDPSGLDLGNSLSPTDGAIEIDVNNDAGFYSQDADGSFQDHLARLLWAT